MSPSESDAETAQFSVAEVVAEPPPLTVMATEDTVGPVLIMVVFANFEVDPPWKSVPVTVQRTLSPEETVDVVNCSVLPVEE